DGIRDFHVTGVQTCALPICPRVSAGMRWAKMAAIGAVAMPPNATRNTDFHSTWELAMLTLVPAAAVNSMASSEVPSAVCWSIAKIGRASGREEGWGWEGGVV